MKQISACCIFSFFAKRLAPPMALIVGFCLFSFSAARLGDSFLNRLGIGVPASEDNMTTHISTDPVEVSTVKNPGGMVHNRSGSATTWLMHAGVQSYTKRD